jgi:nucleoside-diphosphate-sugar epimerase
MKKTTFVIGGSKGIGSVIAHKLRVRGDKVYIISRSFKKKKGFKHLICDLSNAEEINKLKKKTNSIKIDNLIFSQRYRGNTVDYDYNLLLKGTLNFIKTFKSNLKKNSSIVILSSISTTTVLHDQSEEYHYTRGAVEALIKFYACILGKKRIRINGIQPSKLIKPDNKKFFHNEGSKERKIIEKLTPLGRMGTSEDIAYLCDFLTSDMSSFITGTIIPVDGGLRLMSQEGIFKIKK